MKTQKLYAFWSYDQFPYVLSGTVTKINDDSSVETEEYGSGYCFTPVKIVPLKAGLIIKQELDEMKETRRQKLDALREKFDSDLKQKWGFIK
jgi:hypothetical protein